MFVNKGSVYSCNYEYHIINRLNRQLNRKHNRKRRKNINIYTKTIKVTNKCSLKLTKKTAFKNNEPDSIDWKKSQIRVVVNNKVLNNFEYGDLISVPLVINDQDLKKSLVYLKNGIFTTVDSRQGKKATEYN